MIIESIKELRKILSAESSVGFVPTMGYLHEGHLSLIENASKENAKVVVSIFVNPTQFAPNEDFDSYPRDLDRDVKLAISAGADIIFAPSVDEVYISGASTSVIVEGNMTTKLCGTSRPTHFKGVTSIVNILFNIVQPNRAYFGQKDAQQAILLQKMVRDLHMGIEIIVCPIVREEDGLAMSSRNVYLTEEERQQALLLSQSLRAVSRLVEEGERNPDLLKAHIRQTIHQSSLAKIDYIEVLDAYDLGELESIESKALAAVAVWFGKTRLIDNAFLIPKESEVKVCL